MGDDNGPRFPTGGISVQNRSQAWLIDEARRVTKYLSTVHTQLNTYTLINRLPGEILQGIFLHLAASSEQAHDLKWTQITQVCRHWQDVAMNCGVLWTYLTTDSPSYTAACLRRSANARLRLRWDISVGITGYYATHLESLMRIEPHIRRFIVLDAVLRGRLGGLAEPGYLQRLLSRTWPSLESLSFTNKSSHSVPIELVQTLGEDPSRLRSLQLHRALPSSWAFGLATFRNLRTVRLSLRFPRTDHLPTVDELLDFLEKCPVLEELELIRFILKGATENYPDPRRTVPLHRLKSLVLADHAIYDIAFFLSQLSMPQYARIHVHVMAIPSVVLTPLRDCLPRDLSALHILKDVTAVEVQMTGDDDGGKVRMRCSRSTLAAARTDPCLEIIAHFADYRTTTSVFDQVQDIFHENAVHALSVDAPLPMFDAQWARFLTSFPALTTLVVHFVPDEFVGLTDVLLSDLTVDPSLHAQAVVPHLTALHLVGYGRRALADIRKPLTRCIRSRMAAMPDSSLFQLVINGSPRPLTKKQLEEAGTSWNYSLREL